MSDRSGSPSSEGEGDDLRPTAEDRDSSEESSEEDPEEARRIAEGFIQDDDDDDEDEDEDPAARRERKRREKRHRRRRERKQREAEEAELSEDELELLQENRGLGRSGDDRPYKRLKRRSGSPDEGRPTLQDMFRDDEGRGGLDSDDDMEDFIEEDEEEETAKGETEADRRERKRAEKLAAREAAKARPDATGVDRGSWDEIYAVFGDGKEYEWVDEADDEGYDEAEVSGKKDLRLEDVFDPAEIKARRLKDEDRAIAQADRPERYQLVNSTLSDNPILADDTLFPPPTIAGYSLYSKISLRTQYIFCNMHPEGSYPPRPMDDRVWYPAQRRPDLINEFIKAVASALDMMFIQNLEVPYLWHYKRDVFSVLEDRGTKQVQFLNRDELWTLYNLGSKFRAIHNRNGQITDTWARIKAIKPDLQNDYLETTLLGSVCMSSIEAAADGYSWLCYHYPDEIKQIKEEDLEEGGKRLPERSVHDERRSGPIMNFVKEFGIDVQGVAIQFSENGAEAAPIKTSERLPLDLAEEYTGPYFTTADEVVEAAKSILIVEFSKDPTIRQEGRKWVESAAAITVTPTERGMTVIDKYHLYWTFKFLTNKPVESFANDPQFLHMLRAEEEGLITIDVNIPEDSLELFADAMYRCVEAKDYGTVATAWNKLRKDVVQGLVKEHLLPSGSKWLREHMKGEAEDYVAEHCGKQLEYRVNVRPFAAGHMEQGGTPKVIAITNGRGDFKDAVMAAVVDDDGKVKVQTKFDNLKDEADKTSFIELVEKYKPNVIVISGMSVQTARLRDDAYAAVRAVGCRTLGEDPPLPEGYSEHTNDFAEALAAFEQRLAHYLIPLIYVSDDTARQYMMSEESAQEFPGAPPNARYAVALARYTQNPLNAYCKLGKDIASITFMEHHQKLASLQIPYRGLANEQIPQEKLLVHLERALVNAVCSMGIEINSCIADPYQRTMLPFIAGLGPRKADALVNAVNKSGNVVNRMTYSELFGPTILENAAGFLSIQSDIVDMQLEKEEPELQPDPLDVTRIHPEHYNYARKMCENALDLDADDVADQHPSEVVVQLMNLDAKEKKRRLDVLSLDDYAVQLEQEEKVTLKHVLLEVVQELLYYRRDQRPDFIAPEPWDVVKMLTGETRRTVGEGCLVSATVRKAFSSRIICELPAGIEAVLDRDEIDPSWDEKMVQDKYQRGATFKAVVKEFSAVRIAAQLSTGGLEYAYDYINPFADDPYNDTIRQAAAEEAAALKKRRKAGAVKRVVHHPNWHTMNSGQAELYLAPLQRGDVVIRPSSKGADHLAVTWKVDDDVYQHIDVTEIDKPNEYTLGRILRVAGKYSYSDLDDLIINHVKAMARKFDEMQMHEKYRPEDELESYLKNYVQAHPGRSIYGFSVDSSRPGYMKLCFLNKSTKDGGVIQEWPVKVLPGAYMLNNAEVPGVTELCNAFKMQYSSRLADQGSGGKTPGIRAGKTPMGGRTPGGRTPAPGSASVMRGGQTPMQGGPPAGYRQTPMRPGMTPNVYNQGPYGGATPAGGRPPFPPTGPGFARPPPPGPGGFANGQGPPPPGMYGAHPPMPGAGGPPPTLGMNPERAAMIARQGR